MKWLKKSELIYIVSIAIFSFILFVLIIPNFDIDSMNPYLQFILFNVLIFVFLQVFLKSVASDKKIKIMYSIGIVILFIGLDIIIPPYSINTSGKLAGNVTLVKSSSDYIVGQIGSSIGITGILLYMFTYILVPIILLIIASMILKNFVEEL